MTDDNADRSINAIKAQGSYIQRKIEWTQKVVDRQFESIERCHKTIDRAQNMIEIARGEIASLEISLQALRAEYRGMIQKD